ncbi:MAG: hypothetical protein C3F02_04085 [Parcubacteria group bacterium]|nr:MAG: hypothetical protein C3F02_04085 [Parcubacteria group bacterium]
MNFERVNTRQENFDARTRLAELEASGLYVFHGSPYKIETLEPRQAYNAPEPEGKAIPHGEPSVAASPYADVAIFRAIINGENIKMPHSSSFGADIDEENKKVSLHFEVSEDARPKIETAKGYVYVLARDKFKPFENEQGMEWRSAESAQPVEIIEVSGQDMPDKVDYLAN